MLNLFQHLTELNPRETPNQVQGDKKWLITQSPMKEEVIRVYLFNFTIALPQGEVLKPPQLQLRPPILR
jgi:hypothetical protein